MASKRIGIVISEELYERLKSFSDSESETITQTITIAIKNRINTQPIPWTIEHPLIPKIDNLIWLPDVQKTPTTPTAMQESIKKETPQYWKEAEEFFEKHKDILKNTQEDYIKTLIDSLKDESIQYINNHFRRDIKAIMDMNKLTEYKCDFEEWFTGYQEPSDWKYKNITN